jgi:UDP-3-O-[3-hydroxymyristoyl] glucosamine N-acyltransferase
MGETRIGKGTKFADLISIGHGSTIGEHCLFVSLVGISGSVEVGNYVVLGGQVGVAGHLNIGAGARVGAQAGIIGDVPPGETVSGYPARPHREALRAQAALFKLPETLQKIRELERKLSGDG